MPANLSKVATLSKQFEPATHHYQGSSAIKITPDKQKIGSAMADPIDILKPIKFEMSKKVPLH
jgi:hypothetical protein